MIMSMIVFFMVVMVMIMIVGVVVRMHMTLLMNVRFSMFWFGWLNRVILVQFFSK